MQHPKSELIAHLRGELTTADRERVDAHLAACDECRRARDAFGEILDALRASAPAPPEIHWGRWRAELQAKVEARGRRRRWWLSPVPIALSAALAGVLLVVAWQGGLRQATRPDVTSIEEVALEQLDLLEDLELIGHLDRLAPQQEG